MCTSSEDHLRRDIVGFGFELFKPYPKTLDEESGWSLGHMQLMFRNRSIFTKRVLTQQSPISRVWTLPHSSCPMPSVRSCHEFQPWMESKTRDVTSPSVDVIVVKEGKGDEMDCSSDRNASPVLAGGEGKRQCKSLSVVGGSLACQLARES